MRRPALHVKRPSVAKYFDVAREGTRLIAVGERGLIVLSDDGGHQWRQVPVPVSVSLTSVRILSKSKVWVVGHSAVILHSNDAGESWSLRLDRDLIAKIDTQGANVKGRAQKSDDGLRTAAQKFERDEPDKPFFTIFFEESGAGYVAGSYGLILRTSNGGETWTPWMENVDNPKGLNIHAIRKIKNRFYLVGEQGLFCRSRRDSEKFECLSTPFSGSYFAISEGNGDEIIIGGLLGQAYVSTDEGNHWIRISIGTEAAITSIEKLNNGNIVMATERGEVQVRSANGEISPVHNTYKPISSVVGNDDGTLVIAGPLGVQAIEYVPIADKIRERAK